MAYKQHFIDWFSGKQASSYWNKQQIGGSGSTFVGKDEVNGGMLMNSGTSGNNNVFWGFNGKNQFSRSGFVQTAIWRIDPTSSSHVYVQAMCGMASQTNDNGQDVAHFRIFQNNTYIDYRTRSGSTGSFVNTTVPIDTNFHNFKIEAKSASSYEFSVDHTLQGTNTTNLPQENLSPFLKCDDSGQPPNVIGIKYMECYNT